MAEFMPKRTTISKPSNQNTKYLGLLMAALFAVIVIYLSVNSSGANTDNVVGKNTCEFPEQLKPELINAWNIAYPLHVEQVTQGLKDKNSVVLYNLELTNHPFINVVRDCKFTRELDQLASLYSIAFEDQYLDSAKDLKGITFKGWLCCTTNPQEILLYSSQYLYAASSVINAISLIPQSERTESMNRLSAQGPYIADTYMRWIYNNVDGHYPNGLAEGVKALLKNKYRTDDKLLLVAGGVAELLSANREGSGVNLSPDTATKLKEFTDLHWLLIQNRKTIDEAGRMTYDEGWGAIARNKCANHAYTTPPTVGQCTGLTKLSWDISHFTRVYNVIESYHRTGLADGTVLLIGLSKQFTDKVWNGNVENPLFANYFSGSQNNGWYDRTFDAEGKVIRSGTAPYGISSKGTYYFGLQRFNPAIKDIAWGYYKAHPDYFTLNGSLDTTRALTVLALLSNMMTPVPQVTPESIVIKKEDKKPEEPMQAQRFESFLTPFKYQWVSQNGYLENGHYTVYASPGEEVKMSVTLRNKSTDPKALVIYGKSSLLKEKAPYIGGHEIRLGTDKPRDSIPSWLDASSFISNPSGHNNRFAVYDGKPVGVNELMTFTWKMKIANNASGTHDLYLSMVREFDAWAEEVNAKGIKINPQIHWRFIIN